MERLERYLAYLKQNGADLAMKIDPKTIVTAPWTVYKCHYGCGRYGSNQKCPPNVPTWKETQEMIDCYDTAILFMCHKMSVTTQLAVAAARELFLDDYYKVIAFGSGPCKKCETCDPDHCRFPRDTVPSMEACGIDVFATVRANGLEIHTLRDKDAQQDHYGLLLVE